jgi:SAM-dependent methyltransferase
VSAADERTAARLRGWERIGAMEEAYLQIGTVQAAFELGLFGRVADGAATVAALAGDLKVDPRGLGVIVDALCALEFLEKDGDQVGFAPAGQAYLDPRSAAYYGDTVQRVTLSKTALGRLGAAVREGLPLGQTVDDDGSLWAQDIAHSLVDWPAQVEDATQFWRRLDLDLPASARVVDLGCGSGVKVFALADRLPDSTYISVDWHEAVLAVARQVAEAMRIGDRVQTRLADLRSLSLPAESQDLVFASAVLYFYGESDLADLLKRVVAWLRPGGYFVSQHLLADDRRATAADALFRAVQLFLFHPDSRVPSESELVAAAAAAGLRDIRVVDGIFLVGRKPEERRP